VLAGPERTSAGQRVGGVEGRSALRFDLQRRLLEPVGIAAGEDSIGALSPGAPGCLEPDARAEADRETVCPASSGSRWVET
jgi:hypothetical protein